VTTSFGKKYAGLALLVGLLFAACDAQKALTNKRIAGVEHGLMRAAYLKGLKSEKLTLAERMRFYQVPGVSLAVIDKNAIEWSRTYGEKDIQTHQALTSDTVFQAGAFSQMMTAAAVLRLAGEGKLNLEADIGTLLESWRLPPSSESGAKPKITLRALLTHSANVSDHVFLGYAQGEPLPTLPQILDGEPPSNGGPAWVPGRKSSVLRTRYSEPGYMLAEQALTDAGGTPFPELMDTSVLGPLGLKNSTFAVPLPDAFRARAATGHVREGQPVTGLWKNYPEAAAKGLWTTPADFAAFVLDLLRAAAGAPGKILSPEAARTMLSAQVESYGYGFVVEGKGDDLLFDLRGKTHGYACFMAVYPAKGQGAVIMTNSDNGFLLIQEIMAGLSEAYGWAHFRPEEKSVLRLDPGAYGEFVGTYEVNPGYRLEVTHEDYYLVIKPTGQAVTKFYAEGQSLFYATDPYVRIQFLRNKAGDVEGLVLWQQDFELEAKKIR
jgi:CubicO group peptidase (beta-lactamase class C family)